MDWVWINKEWLFSGAGVVVVTLLFSLFLRIRNLWRDRSPSKNRKQPVKRRRAAIRKAPVLTSFLSLFVVLYRWFVDLVRAIRKHFAEKETRRKRNLYQQMAESTVFFSRRFAEAFPGCRNVLIIDDPAEAVRRLDILLRKPLSIEVNDKCGSFGMDPIWWFRGWQNLPIRTYKKLRKYLVFPTSDILFNGVELHRVRRVVAFGSMAYWANVVYVETDGVQPSGLYGHGLSEYAKERGYSYEEVGIYKGRFIRREEYDDGAAIINGKVVQTRGKERLQVRYLSPFNFFIVPIASPINDNNYDRMFEEALKGALKGEVSLEGLASMIRRLPRNPKEDIIEQGVRENLAKL
jgi:hypothetical protein